MGTSLPKTGAAARPSSPIPRKHFALLEARGQMCTALPPKCSKHGLWATACGSVRGSQLQRLQIPASWQGQCCHLHGDISEVAKHWLCSFFGHQLPMSHLHLPEMGPEQWMCIYPVVCLEVEGEEGICRLVQCLMWVTSLCHFTTGTQQQQIPGNLIPEIDMEELKQQYLSSASDCQFRGGSEPPWSV